MKKAGVDFGLTSTKIYWINDKGEDLYLSSREISRSSLVSVLRHSGVTDVCIGGNGPTEGFERFRLHRLSGDPIKNEKLTQAKGARHLLLVEARPPETKHIVVSIGTGTSYVAVNGEGYDLPIGSTFGAGSIDGLLTALQLGTAADLDKLLGANGASYDLMVSDAVPALRGTPYDHWIAASYAKAARRAEGEAFDPLKFAKSALNQLAADVYCRLALFEETPYRGSRDVVVLGALPHRSHVVRELIETTIRLLGKTPIFPKRGEYALAVGAFQAINP